MAESRARIAPRDVIDDVDRWIGEEISQAERYDNRELLDSSGCWSLHALAALIYARGWTDGERAESARSESQRRRERDAAAPAVQPEETQQ